MFEFRTAEARTTTMESILSSGINESKHVSTGCVAECKHEAAETDKVCCPLLESVGGVLCNCLCPAKSPSPLLLISSIASATADDDSMSVYAGVNRS